MLRLPTLRARSFRPCNLRPFNRLVSTAPPLIRIENATFYKNYPTPEDEAKGVNPPLFPNLNFTLPSAPVHNSREYWAVIGHPARSELLDVLRGSHICLPPNGRSYPYLLTDEIARKDPRLRYPGNAIQYIGFSGEGSGAIGGTRGAYLSARYESLREETDWTVQQYLRGQTSLNPLDEEKQGTVRDEELFSQVVTDLRLSELLDMPVANLSNGQTRRTRIAKALLGKPELLLLDDPFMGLDPATVRSISGLLHGLAEKDDPRLVLSLRPQDKIPDWITHVVVVGNSNRILLQGSRAQAQTMFGVWSNMVSPLDYHNQGNEELREKAQQDINAGYLDIKLIYDLGLMPGADAGVVQSPIRGGEPLVEMDGVRVEYGDKIVLGDWVQKVKNEKKEGLTWKVRRGHRWAILGPNGSGKTTLLSLITSDHPQAYALPIKLFGRSRLPEPGKPAISLFELQSRLGHSSPEIHAFFPRQLTIRQAVESAFAETFLSKPKLDHEHDLDISCVLRYFRAELDPKSAEEGEAGTVSVELDRKSFPKVSYAQGRNPIFLPHDYEVDYADEVTFGQLSTPQQRLVLFLRAIVHRPDIIILDEPFSGMSSSVRDKCIHFLEVGETPYGVTSTALRRAGYKDLKANASLVGKPKDEPKAPEPETEAAAAEALKEPEASPAPETSETPEEASENLEDLEDLEPLKPKRGRPRKPGSPPPKPKAPSGRPKLAERHVATMHPIRYRGITEDQALIMISHVPEEIPDIVRHWIRLPTTNSGDEAESGIDFRFGLLKAGHSLSQTKVWEKAWAPAKKFIVPRNRGLKRPIEPGSDDEVDEKIYEWWSI